MTRELTPLQDLPVMIPREQIRPIYEIILNEGDMTRGLSQELMEANRDLTRMREYAAEALIAWNGGEINTEGLVSVLRDIASNAKR